MLFGFFCLSGEFGAGPLRFEACSLESLNLHVLCEAKPQWDHNPSCASAREKQASKQTTKQTVQMEFNPFTGVAFALCFTQAA